MGLFLNGIVAGINIAVLNVEYIFNIPHKLNANVRLLPQARNKTMCTANRVPLVCCPYCYDLNGHPFQTLMVWMEERRFYCPRCDAYRFVVNDVVVRAK